EATYGPDHLYLLLPLVGLGKVSVARDDNALAAGHFRRGVAIGEHTGTNHALYGEALAGLAECVAVADLAQARELLARAVAVYEADGDATLSAIAPLALRAGQLAVAASDLTAARPWLP